MTLEQAINIKNCDIDITTGEKITHSEIYTRAINLLGGLDAVIPHIPFSIEEIKIALEHYDEHLNTLPLRTWDFASNSLRRCFNKVGVTVIPISQCVCTLKQAARQWAEREATKANGC